MNVNKLVGNTVTIEVFDVAKMPAHIKPVGSSTKIDTRSCTWYTAHGRIDGRQINSPLLGIDRGKKQIFIGDTRNLDEFYPVDMAHAKALRQLMDKLISS